MKERSLFISASQPATHAVHIKKWKSQTFLKSKFQNYFCHFASDEGRKDIRQNDVLKEILLILPKTFSDLLVGNLNPHVFRSNYTCYIFVHAQVKLG